MPAVLGLHPLGPSMAVGVTSNMGTTSGVTDSVESTSLLIGSSSSKGHSNVSNNGWESKNVRGVGNTDRGRGVDLLKDVLAVLMSTMAMISSCHSGCLVMDLGNPPARGCHKTFSISSSLLSPANKLIHCFSELSDINVIRTSVLIKGASS